MLVHDSKLHQSLKSMLPPGTRIECLKMVDDPYPVLPGTHGTVTKTNGFGQIHVNWDTGSTLALIHNKDLYKKI